MGAGKVREPRDVVVHLMGDSPVTVRADEAVVEDEGQLLLRLDGATVAGFSHGSWSHFVATAEKA